MYGYRLRFKKKIPSSCSRWLRPPAHLCKSHINSFVISPFLQPTQSDDLESHRPAGRPVLRDRPIDAIQHMHMLCTCGTGTRILSSKLRVPYLILQIIRLVTVYKQNQSYANFLSFEPCPVLRAILLNLKCIKKLNFKKYRYLDINKTTLVIDIIIAHSISHIQPNVNRVAQKN